MWMWLRFEAVWVCQRGSPTTLASAHTCTRAALMATALVLQAQGTWARRCGSTRC
jgi:hypothetical protein